MHLNKNKLSSFCKKLFYIYFMKEQMNSSASPQPKLDQVLELWPLIDSFKARLKLHGGAAKALLSELPTKETMVSQVVNCFGNWAPIMTARKLNQTRCPNHYICPFHDAADSNCLVYDAKWSVNMVPMPTQRFGVVVAFYQSTKYVLSKGCKSNIK